MSKEIEAKFTSINIIELIGKLEQIGAVKVYDERMFRRCVYNLPIDKPGAWGRIRDEGDKITMTYKCVTAEHIDSVEEVEIIINDFDKGRAFLSSIGLIEKAYQESKRMRYVLKDPDVEFDIDTWPALDPWLEVEAESEELVREYAEKLGFDWNTARFGSADFIYASVYNVTEDWINNHCPLLQFDNLPAELSDDNKR